MNKTKGKCMNKTNYYGKENKGRNTLRPLLKISKPTSKGRFFLSF